VQTNAHHTGRAHCDGAPVHYERHRPEQTTLYRLVQQHAQSFFAQSEEAAGARLPQFVRDEFDAFLECGILAHGFLRLRCGDCGHDKLLAFSCKRRGFCPSCGARRMSQTAAHLVEHVIPHVPVRQWVLSLPIPLRLLLVAQPELVTPVLQVVQRVVTRYLLDGVGLNGEEGQGGAVTLIQRFGSAANLNIHLHCLVLDGVYRCGADGVPVFVQAGAPSDDELHALLHTVITRLMKVLTRHGVLIEEMGQTWLVDPNTDGDEARTLRPLQAAAIAYRIVFGPRAGHKVLTLRGARGHGVRASVFRHRRVQPSRGRSGRSTRAQAAGAAVPHHHPAGAGRRTGTARRRRSGGAQAQDPPARRHHAPGNEPAGVPAAIVRAGAWTARSGFVMPLAGDCTVSDQSRAANVASGSIAGRQGRRWTGAQNHAV
jgi:hypothetical protein